MEGSVVVFGKIIHIFPPMPVEPFEEIRIMGLQMTDILPGFLSPDGDK